MFLLCNSKNKSLDIVLERWCAKEITRYPNFAICGIALHIFSYVSIMLVNIPDVYLQATFVQITVMSLNVLYVVTSHCNIVLTTVRATRGTVLLVQAVEDRFLILYVQCPQGCSQKGRESCLG